VALGFVNSASAPVLAASRSYWITEQELDESDAFCALVGVRFSGTPPVNAVIKMRADSDTSGDFATKVLKACNALRQFYGRSNYVNIPMVPTIFPAHNVFRASGTAVYSVEMFPGMIESPAWINSDHLAGIAYTTAVASGSVAELYDLGSISTTLMARGASDIHKQRAVSPSTKFQAALQKVDTVLTDEDRELAIVAIHEAIQTLHSISVPEPWVGVNSEGAAIVQWRGKTSGVVLVFTGDGTFTASVKKDQRSRYIDEAAQFRAAGDFPESILGAIFAVH